MSSQLEHLFYAYWNSDARNNHDSDAFRDLQDHAIEIVTDDPDMDWMDNITIATIVHHVLDIECDISIKFRKTLWTAVKENSKISIQNGSGDHIVSLCFDRREILEPEQSHLSIKDYIYVSIFGVEVRTKHKSDVVTVQNSYRYIERFLEQERRLFQKDLRIFFSIPYAPAGTIISQRAGEWMVDGSFGGQPGSLADVLMLLSD